MSDSGGPTRRRRIAGETPAKKATAKKATAKKATAKKATAKKATAKKATAKKAPAKKVATAKAVTPAGAKKIAPAPPRQVIPKTPVIAKAQGEALPSARDLRWLVPLIALTIASLVVGGWLAFQGVQDIRDDGARASTEKEASSAASAAAETIFSYTFDKLDVHLTDSKKLMTSTFAKDFDKIAPALDEIAPQRKVQVEAVSRNAAALSCGDECSPGTVNVLVFLDQARLVDGATQPDVIGNRVTMKMVHRDGVWLVDDIRAL